MNQVRIAYDDDQIGVVAKINDALKGHGLVLVDDGLVHDGYCVFLLQTVVKSEALSESVRR